MTHTTAHRSAPERAVVTGAGSGIGAALADALHRRGTTLVLTDIDADALARTAARTDAETVVGDVADPDAVEALGRRAAGATLVCLNAGIVGHDLGAPWEVSAQDWARVFEVNVAGLEQLSDLVAGRPPQPPRPTDRERCGPGGAPTSVP